MKENFDWIEHIDPYVRWVKIDKSVSLTGKWIDYDNVFTFIASGSATFILNGESYTVLEGDVVICPPGLRHIITSDKSKPFTEFIFHFDLFRRNSENYSIKGNRIPEGTVRRVAEDEMMLARLPMVIRPPDEISERIRRHFLTLFIEYNEKRSCAQSILMQAYVKAMLLISYSCTLEKDAVAQESIVYSWNSIQRIVEIIQNRYHHPRLSIQSIADIVGFSPNYISTLVKNNLGVTIHEYLTFVRIEAAKQMLYESSKNITQISEYCGFSSVYAFSRSFKRETGLSPSQYAHKISVRIS